MVDTRKVEEELGDLFGLGKDVVIMRDFSPVPFVEKLMEVTDFVYDKNKRLWMYDSTEGIWVTNIEQRIKTVIRKNLMGDTQQKKQYVDEILNYLKDITYNDKFELNPYDNLVAFKNKVYDLKDGKFINFRKDLYLTNKLHIDIDENITECPKIDKFFEDCVGKDLKSMLYELPAYCLYKKYPYQKLFFIYGSGGTGKTQYLNLIESFLGERNRCSIDPQQLEKDKFVLQNMVGKLANISSDISYDALNNISTVKKMTGGDTVSVREMYKNPYNTKIYAKQIFSTNQLPVVKEKTRAWYRRVYLISFFNIVSEDKMDRNLLKKLTTDDEMKGFAFKCLQSLKELYDNDFIFTYDIDIDKMAELYEHLSNPIMMFINQNCTSGEGQWVWKWEFFEKLNLWLKQNHFSPYKKSELNKYMADHYRESAKENPISGKLNRIWVGFSWKNEENEDNPYGFYGFYQDVKLIYIYKRSLQTP